MLEKLAKTKPASLLNAVFKATKKLGASFAKKEVSFFIPFEIFKKERKRTGRGDVKSGTRSVPYSLPDINFRSNRFWIKNARDFFTAEIHEGVKVISDQWPGNFIFEGSNDVTKPTIGYYSHFISQDDQKYDLFMSCAEKLLIGRNSQFQSPITRKFEPLFITKKIVVRNLMKKIIPKISEPWAAFSRTTMSGIHEYEEIARNQPTGGG